jgi:hypothetical protein
MRNAKDLSMLVAGEGNLDTLIGCKIIIGAREETEISLFTVHS